MNDANKMVTVILTRYVELMFDL